MRVLVGIPCFRLPDLTRECLKALEGPATVVAVDNAADRGVKEMLKGLPSVHVLVSETNGFCNGGWNRIMEYGLHGCFDIIGLGCSDVVLDVGWYENLLRHAERPNEVWIPALGDEAKDAPKTVHGGLPGYFTFFPRKAIESVYPIPDGLRQWFGDQYMYEKLRRESWSTVILNDVRATHRQSAVMMATPEVYEVIEQDKIAWEAIEAKRKAVA